MKISGMDRRDYQKKLDEIEAVIKLAGANFPGSTDVRIETAGGRASASMFVPCYFMSFMVNAAREALNKESEVPAPPEDTDHARSPRPRR